MKKLLLTQVIKQVLKQFRLLKVVIRLLNFLRMFLNDIRGKIYLLLLSSFFLLLSLSKSSNLRIFILKNLRDSGGSDYKHEEEVSGLRRCTV